MDMVSPVGPVYQAGTLSGNPAAAAAGLETLRILKEDPEIYGRLERKAKTIADTVRSVSGGTAQVNQVGSLLSIFFTDREVRDYESALSSDTARYSRYFGRVLDQGIYVAPSQFEAMFVSDAHTDEDIEVTCQVLRNCLSHLLS